METTTPRHITLAEIEDLQIGLQFLHQQIQAIKARLDPLEKQIDRVFKEYQAAMRTYQARIDQLNSELNKHRQGPIRQQTNLEDKKGPSTGDKEAIPSSQTSMAALLHQKQTIDKSQEAIDKDQLLEYLIWAIEEPNDQKHMVLVSSLTEMNQMPSVSLADMLEQLPTDFFEIATSVDREDLPGWFNRLETWHKALSRQLEKLQIDETNQSRGQKYQLWQQYQQGSQVWAALLEKHRDLFRKRIQRLEAELSEMG